MRVHAHAQVRTSGEKLRGANEDPQLTFFSTTEDVVASNDFAKCLMSAILSDCDVPDPDRTP